MQLLKGLKNKDLFFANFKKLQKTKNLFFATSKSSTKTRINSCFLSFFMLAKNEIHVSK